MNTQITPALFIQLQRTARALSCRPVVLEVEQDINAAHARWLQRMGQQKQSAVNGYCVETVEGVAVIGLYAGLSVSDLYQVFLHEAAHAYLTGQVLADPEAAAWKLASIWAVWIARRNPKDAGELLEWLRQLEHLHENKRL